MDSGGKQSAKQRGYFGIRHENQNSLLIAATLLALDSQGQRSGVLTKLCDHILAFAEKTMKDE